jgi:hypothetical protein
MRCFTISGLPYAFSELLLVNLFSTLLGYHMLRQHFWVALKRQYHESIDPRFFHQTVPSRALIQGLKLFRKWLRIR